MRKIFYIGHRKKVSLQYEFDYVSEGHQIEKRLGNTEHKERVFPDPDGEIDGEFLNNLVWKNSSDMSHKQTASRQCESFKESSIPYSF